MPTLEEKIKAIMSGHQSTDSMTEEELNESIDNLEDLENLEEKEVIKTKGGTTITDDDSDDKDDSTEDSEGEDSEGSDDGVETEVSKQDKVKVNEGNDPFGKLTDTDGTETGSAKTAKIKAGLDRTEGSKDSLKMNTSADSQDDNGDNARIQAGASKKDSAGKLSDGATGTNGTNEPNEKNNKGTDLQKGAASNVKEHIDAIMNGEELTEEFRTKVETIFEAAVEQAAEQRINELKEQFDEELVEAVEEAKQELVEQIDGFLNTIVEQWVEDNAVALESAMKVEVVNSFIDGLKDLFKEHYFDVPEDKLDIVEDQATQINELTTQLSALVDITEGLQTKLNDITKKSIVEQVSSDLTKVEKEKFDGLTEKVEFESEEDFTNKVKTIKENYFPKGKGGDILPGSEDSTKVTETVNTYVDAIAKNLKF